jgi:hypothetical protein
MRSRSPPESHRYVRTQSWAAQGSINGYEFQTVLEPDGLKGHWMKVDQELQQAADVGVSDLVQVLHRAHA